MRPLKTSQGILESKSGFLIQIQDDNAHIGWGEVAPIEKSELKICESILKEIGNSPTRNQLEKDIGSWPGTLGFGIGAALAELDCLIGSQSTQEWLPSPKSAILLPTDKSPIETLMPILKSNKNQQQKLTFKWKVGNYSNEIEKKLIHDILVILPNECRLRLDVNGGWQRAQAMDWVNNLYLEPKIEWIEQPLPANDIAGLQELSKKMPIALDESLLSTPSLRGTWDSWQIRRPTLEGDPRLLLKTMHKDSRYIAISTSFETGIGLRWVNHFAGLQAKGATPTAPGMAPGWCPVDNLFSANPKLVWKAA
ncbi:o-succinylbenzoate synthase [Prochlorococcus marinus]|uniref:o-succinylbenzoate synthase n=1 Tax=Prochlorococcus marinus TaxID=1219 RepID=UPI0022B2CB49|nr:o-succinylbenzoate synthase [Prochlorococcus marinus]